MRASGYRSKILLPLVIAFVSIYSCRKQEYLSDRDMQADMIEEAKLLYERTANGSLNKTPVSVETEVINSNMAKSLPPQISKRVCSMEAIWTGKTLP